jgi:hypothetical protein
LACRSDLGSSPASASENRPGASNSDNWSCGAYDVLIDRHICYADASATQWLPNQGKRVSPWRETASCYRSCNCRPKPPQWLRKGDQ